MPTTEQAFNQVRQELCDLGLLDDGVYLDEIELVIVPKITAVIMQAHGFVFDKGVGFWRGLIGFKAGTIYMAPEARMREQLDLSYTITDVVRHEFAHAWYWLDPDFFDAPWFEKAFGRPYASVPDEFGSKFYGWYEENPHLFKKEGYANDYAIPYAMSSSSEDFAETFRWFMRYGNSMDRFKSRKKFYSKLVAVRAAIRRKARELKR